MAFASINPATGETFKTFESLTAAELDEKLSLAASTFTTYRGIPFADRAEKMRWAADILDADKDTLARTMTLEVGKTLRSSVEEVEKCARCCRFYAGNAERFLAPEVIATEADYSGIQYQPLGPI